MRSNFLKITIRFFIVLITVFLLFYLSNLGFEKEAQYTIDGLQQYMHSLKIIEGRPIESLKDLPSISILSAGHNFLLKFDSLREETHKGYRYYFKNLENGKFILCASPVGKFLIGKEFAITEQGILKYNSRNVDVQQDSYEEIEKWNELSRVEAWETKRPRSE